MALAEAVWIDPPRSYDRRRQIARHPEVPNTVSPGMRR